MISSFMLLSPSRHLRHTNLSAEREAPNKSHQDKAASPLRQKSFMLEEHFSCTVCSVTASVILLFTQKLGILSFFTLIMHFTEC